MSAVTRLDDHRQTAAPVRPLPANVEAEQAVIGSILLNNATWHALGGRLEPEHFSEELHRRIWEVASALIRDGKVASPVTLPTFLGNHELATGVTIARYLAGLAAEACSPLTAPDHARLVSDLHMRRQLIAAYTEALEQAYDPPVSAGVDKLVDGALEAIRQIGDALPGPDADESIDATLGELIGLAQDNIEGKSSPVTSSGLPDMDRTLGGGLRGGRLIVLAGRPGMGKSVIATALARRAAQKGAGVGFFSLEIDRQEFAARLAANAVAGGATPMDYRDILTGQIGEGQIERLAAARAWLKGLPIELCDRSGITIQQIETRAVKMGKRFARVGKRLDVVVIDYLGLVKVEDRYRGNQVAEYGEIALGAKNMAKRLDCCVILLAQLSRGVESRDSKRPILSDLRASGNIEEHADAVGLLYRPEYYDKHDPKVMSGDAEAVARADGRRNLLELIWEKNRLGPTATDQFFCDVAKSQIDSLSRHSFGGA